MVKQYNYATNLMDKPYLTRGVAKKSLILLINKLFV